MIILQYIATRRYNLLDIGIFAAVGQALTTQEWLLAALIFFPGIILSTILEASTRP